MNYQEIIDRFYPDENQLRTTLLTHSRLVAEKAVRIAECHYPELLEGGNTFLFDAAMLHDIVIVRCDAAGISCYGTEPYIRHGMIGAEMLRDIDPSLEPYARVCERHTGTGLRVDDIVRQQLPLPHRDFVPETLEEQIICYADKFFSKTHPEEEKALERVERSLERFGEASLRQFRQWHEQFGV